MMIKLRIAAIGIFSMILAYSCIASSPRQMELLYGVSIDKNKIYFVVKSSGCSHAEDFQVALKKAKEQLTLSVIRISPDRCRGMPKQVSLAKNLDFSSTDSKLDVVLLNPLKLIN